VSRLQLVVEIGELSELELGLLQDGHDEVRREIKQLLATIKALAALLPRPE
jgi:hypothetical protein